MDAKWLTITKLRRALRPGGCLQAKRHAKAMLEVGHTLRCYVAHPPTHDDEVAASQRWFARVKPSTRRTNAFGRWDMKIRIGRRRTQKGATAALAVESTVVGHGVRDHERSLEPVPGTPAWRHR